MGYERNQRGGWRNDDERNDDYGRDYGASRDQTYSGGRDYAGAGQYGERYRYGADRDRSEGRDYYGARTGYGSRDESRGGFAGRDYGRDQGGYGNRDSYGYGERDRGYGERSFGQSGYGGRDSYASGNRFEGRQSYGRGYGDDDRQRAGYQRQQGYGERGRVDQPQGYDYEERGFFNRAGDEVRSWFGDEDAERRREADRRYDERYGNSWGERDDHYSSWRRQRIGELDRDYDEYRRENATKFENEFNSFRTERQTQRSSLAKVSEHMEVVGSDGEHVGTVDKVRGDRIVLTKNDADAGGRHHSIPSRWIDSVDDKVRIRKTAQEAKNEWRDEERNQAMFGDDQRGTAGYGAATYGQSTTGTTRRDDDSDTSGTTGNLNKSFSGTY